MSDNKIGYILQPYPAISEQFIAREIDALRVRNQLVQVFALHPDPYSESSDNSIYYSLRHLAKDFLFLAALILVKRADIHNVHKSLKGHSSRVSLWLNTFRALFIIRHLNKLGIHHIHCHFMTMPTLLGYLISSLSATTYSVSGHAKDIFHPEYPQSPELFKKADHIFFCTKTGMKHFKERFPDVHEGKLCLMHHGLTFDDTPHNTTTKNNDLIFAGRLVGKKGLIYLLQAIDKLHAEGRNIRLKIFGNGPLKKALAGYIQKHELAEFVTLNTFIPQVELCIEIKQSILFIHPCIESSSGDIDGIPNVVLEAMQAKTAVIAGQIPALHEIFTNGSDIALVDPKHVTNFAESIIQLLDDANKREQLADAAFATISKRFDIDENIKQMYDYFQTKHNPRTNILHALEATIGGTRKHIRLILDGLSKDKFLLSLIYSDLRSADFHKDIEHFENHGINTIRIPMRRNISPASDVLATASFTRTLLNNTYDIVHLHSSKAGTIGRIACWLCGYKRVIYSPHAFAFLGANNPISRRLLLLIEQVLGKLTERIIAVSESEKTTAIKHRIVRCENEITIARNGLPITTFYGSRTQSKIRTIGFIGRIEPQKGCDVFLKSIPSVMQTCENIKVLIFGAGSLSIKMKKLCQSLGLEYTVEFKGNCIDHQAGINAIDLLVAPSRWEGYPYLILEALQSRTPLIASDIPAHQEILGKDYPFTFSKDNSQDLAAKILICLKHPSLPHKAIQSVAKKHNYSLNNQIKTIENAYQL